MREIVSDAWIDLRFAIRTLPRISGVLSATLSVAIAVGAASAVWDAAAWLLKGSSAGLRDSNRLSMVRQRPKGRTDAAYGFSYTQLKEIERAESGFESIAGYSKIVGVVTDERGASERVIEYVTENYLDVLGVRPIAGRGFIGDDGAPAAIIAYSLWNSKYARSSGVLGSVIHINGASVTIIGVLPDGFQGFSLDWYGPADIWIPMKAAPRLGAAALTNSALPSISIVGRRKADVPIEIAAQRATSWVHDLSPASSNALRDPEVVLFPASEGRIARRSEAKSFLGSLFNVTLVVIFAASVSLSNAVFGRAAERSRELGIRTALGASHGRIARQLLLEGCVLGLVTGLAAVAAASIISAWLRPLPSLYLGVPMPTQALVTPMVGLMTSLGAVGSSVLIAVVFGTLPSMWLSLRPPVSGLRDLPQSLNLLGRRVNGRKVLLAPQIALATCLSIIAGAQIDNLVRMSRPHPQYVTPNKVQLMTLISSAIDGDRRPTFYRQTLERLKAMPGVTSVALGWNAPFTVGQNEFASIEEPERTVVGGSTAVSGDFFASSGIALLSGREFDGSDADLEGAAIVNSVLAKRLWPTGSALGRRFRYGKQTREVVGVVADDRCNNVLSDPMPCAWRPFPMNSPTSVLRVRMNAEGQESRQQVKALVLSVSPFVAISGQTDMAAIINKAVAPERMVALAATSLGALSITLLAVGAAALFTGIVKRRRREIAIRMAVGAPRSKIIALIFREGSGVCLVGLGLGFLAAYAVRSMVLLSNSQVNLTRTVMTIGPVIVSGVAFGALTAAALQAAGVQPAMQLRQSQ